MSNLTSARLHLPPPSLAGCVHLAVERNTRGRRLCDAQRFNFYPASPFPMISWIFEGELRMVEDGDGSQSPRLTAPLPRVVFSGPYRKPSASWSPGVVHALSVSFYPEGLSRLLGIRIERYLDTILPLDSVASGPILEPFLRIACHDDYPPFQQIEAALRPLWRDLHVNRGAADLRGWLRSLAVRAAFTKAGTSLRQVQRRIKDWTGQSYRDLRLYARAEEALVRSAGGCANATNLAAVAAEAGYSDQSHLGREVRRVTGLSPGRLTELARTDEAFWLYRLLSGHLHDGPGP